MIPNPNKWRKLSPEEFVRPGDVICGIAILPEDAIKHNYSGVHQAVETGFFKVGLVILDDGWSATTALENITNFIREDGKIPYGRIIRGWRPIKPRRLPLDPIFSQPLPLP